MNKKAKRFYTRRQSALRTAGLALVLLLFCNGVLHIGFLLPAQACRYAAQRAGVYGRVETVAAQWKPGMMHATDRLYLVEGEGSLSLQCTYFASYGWDPSYLWPLDTSDGADVHAGVVGMSRDGREDTVVFYGRIDTPNVARLELHGKNASGNRGFALGVSHGDWFVRDGKTYLLLADPFWFGRGEQAEYYLIVETADSETAEYPIEQVAGVYWG